MNDMVKLMDHLGPQEGFNETLIPGVRIYRASESQPRQPLTYEQGIIIVAQGTKRVFLGGQCYEYDPENYLVLSVPIPAECETLASEQEPLLCMSVDIDVAMLNRIITLIDLPAEHFQAQKGQSNKTQTSKGLFVASVTEEVSAITLRTLRAANSSVDARVIGPSLVHELVFRVLCGSNSEPLYALAMQNTSLARVGKALRLIHSNYQDPLDVTGLAESVNMSPSAFHRMFKEVTASSPIQYLKKIRLNKAWNLLAEKGVRVNEAAITVGYESVSQFSREFKRYYGHAPVNVRLVGAH